MPFSNWTRVLFEAIDDAVFVHDAEGNILEANPAACRRLGYTREELLKLNTRDIDAPEFAAGFEGRLNTQLHDGSFRCEGVHRTKSGRRIYVDINTSAIHLEDRPAVLAVMRDITDRKETEEALSKQSQLLQSILDNMSDAIVVAGPRGHVVLANPAATHIFGPGLMQGHFQLYHANGRQRLTEFPVARCVRGESFDELELFVTHEQAPDGLSISVAGRPLRERDGALKGGVLVCIDVTEQRRVEKQLRDSQALYESLVELLPQHILRKDRQGRLTFGNARYCATLKRSLPELLGKTDFDLFPHDVAAKYVRDDQDIMHTGQTLDAIEEHYLPDGRRLYVHIVKTPVVSADNEVVGVQGIFWDVTQEVLANEAVANSEKRYRQLTEATMDGIVVVGPKGEVILFNPAAERMFGYSAMEVLGMPAHTLFPEEFKDLGAAGGEAVVPAHRHELLGQPHETKGKRKDGSEFPVEVALSLLAEANELQNGEQSTAQILAAIRDLTERNKMRALMVQNEKLASIGLLSAGVAHEINNPLAFVANNLVVLERDSKGLLAVLDLYRTTHAQIAASNAELAAKIDAVSEESDLPYVQENMARIISRTRDGIERVTRIVHSLRGMARTDAPKRQDARLPDMINNSLEILHGKYKRLGVVVEQSHDPDPVVPCVPTQIGQVVLNLLVNSFQAIEASKRTDGRLSIRTRRLDGEMLLEIKDNGGGIKPEHLSRLFDPFFTTKDVGEGTGLGLSISHHIISAHGGRIEVDPNAGDGTCFRVYLPLKNSPSPPGRGAGAEGPMP